MTRAKSDTNHNFSKMNQRMPAVAASPSHLYAQTTRRGKAMLLLLAIVLLLAIATGEGVLYRVAYFLTLVTVVSYVQVRLRLRRLHMRMENKFYVGQVGNTLKGRIYLHNDSRLRTGWVEIVPMTNMPGGISGVATSVSAGGQQQLETHTFCPARGVYTLGPLRARTSDPLGLFRVEITQGNPMKLVVQPPIVALPYFHLPEAELSGVESAQSRSQTRTPHVSTVREYIHGDSLNQIHWLSTAKSGQLMSKEFDSGRGGDVWIVLDLERKIHHTQGMERTDECAVAIAASLTNLILREEHSVGLIAYGDHDYRLPLGVGTKQMSSVLEILTLSKTEGDSPLAKVLVKNSGQFDRASSLLVITSSTVTEWISALQELRYRSVNVGVVLIDPTSFGGEQPLDKVTVELVRAGIPVYLVHRGDPLAYALSRPVVLHEIPEPEQCDQVEQVPSCAI
jgi:uncharacterized protein (DUF58 family)